MKSLLQLLRRPLLHVAGLSFFVNLLLLVPALFMLQVFDRVLASQSGETLLVLMIGVGVALTLLLALDYLRAPARRGRKHRRRIAVACGDEDRRRAGRSPQRPGHRGESA